ncbi:5-hydroxytryptamine receptor 1B [Venturia canescens]|uniref:5-hydroxytryptamine receptor 1B n=1 Tax=Venturia canescens TaxID=32260 RepID=UPI001C9BFDA0|nr:5-hydroxytryptamine receptor 1B [Venturia canescens]
MKNFSNRMDLLSTSMVTVQRSNKILHAINLDATIEQDEFESVSEYYIYWAILDGLLFIIIVVGNILTILAVRLTRKLRQVSSNLFVLNLAISDLMVGFTLIYHLAFYMYKSLGEHKPTCILRFVIATLACSLSLYSLMTIAIDRYIGVMHPLKYAQHVTRVNVIIIIVVGWLNAIAISTVPIFWNCFDEVHTCEFQTILPRDYATMILCPLVCLIWTSLFFLYWRIWRAAESHARRLRESGFDNPHLHDCKGSKAVLSILGCFSICWLPYLIIACTRLFILKSTGTLYKALFSLAMANSGMNPIIYAWKNSQFRKAFRNLLRFKSPNSNTFNASLNDYLKKQRKLTERESG